MTLAVLASLALSGMDALAVGVETHLASVLPTFGIVGLPDVEVHESRERVRAAILNSGFNFPAGRLTVTLSPADIPKESARFDLPIALGVLLASGQINAPAPTQESSQTELRLDTLVLAGSCPWPGLWCWLPRLWRSPWRWAAACLRQP